MTKLPTFLCIGVPRAATTWLYEALQTHDQVYVPSLRKEIHFFDSNWERGLDWYRRFFADAPDDVVAIGEVTPHYLFHPDALDRIAALGTVRKLLVLLRNPVDRAYSHYSLKIRNWNYRGSFADFLEEFPEARSWGRYAAPLERVYERFGRDQVLVMIQEEVRDDTAGALEGIARFLDVDPAGFEAARSRSHVNRGFVPRHRFAYRAAMGAVKWLNRHDLEWVVRLGKRAGMKQRLSEGSPIPPISADERARLTEEFRGEARDVERVLGRPIPRWREAGLV